MVMFDLPPPLQCKGIEAYERAWNLLFRYQSRRVCLQLASPAADDLAKEEPHDDHHHYRL
jgi:hypothetical protein